ncbi:MAG: ABC transporter permease [Firmicutes bacterium]|nr:ABC transporter permease [Bacillota bacterium]MDH7496548.1 ABC transporter permease [Bacillota bacterium]
MRIALRNLGRARARTALSLISIAAGVFVVVLTKGTVDGIVDTIVVNSIRLTSGHVRVIAKEYPLKERLLSLNYPVDGFRGEGYESITEALREIPLASRVVPRLRFGAMVSKGEELEGLLAVGVDPEAEERLIGLTRYLVEGRLLRPGEREAVMGHRTLDRLGLEVGDRFTLVFSTALGSLKGYTFVVTGSVRSGLQYLDDGLVFVPLDVAQAMLDMGSAVTEVLVMAEDEASVPKLVRDIEDMLKAKDGDARYVAQPWYNQNEMMRMLIVASTSYNLVYLFILFLASFVVINTMLMIVNERRREIGMMGALGLRPEQVRWLFLLEGGVMGAIGSAAGAIVGTTALRVLRDVGIPIPGASTVDKVLLMPSKLYPRFSWDVVAFAFVAGIVVTLIAVSWPSDQAAKIEPTQALRTQ